MPGSCIIPLRWNVKRDVRASTGAYGGGNGVYERVGNALKIVQHKMEPV